MACVCFPFKCAPPKAGLEEIGVNPSCNTETRFPKTRPPSPPRRSTFKIDRAAPRSRRANGVSMQSYFGDDRRALFRSAPCAMGRLGGPWHSCNPVGAAGATYVGAPYTDPPDPLTPLAPFPPPWHAGGVTPSASNPPPKYSAL